MNNLKITSISRLVDLKYPTNRAIALLVVVVMIVAAVLVAAGGWEFLRVSH